MQKAIEEDRSSDGGAEPSYEAFLQCVETDVFLTDPERYPDDVTFPGAPLAGEDLLACLYSVYILDDGGHDGTPNCLDECFPGWPFGYRALH
jgi:hypothetical protein